MKSEKKHLEKEIKSAVKAVAKKKAKKVVAKSGMGVGQHAAALNYSSYLRTLLDPVNNPGVKIPDEVTTPSYTVQTLDKRIVPTAAGTGAGAGTVGAGYALLIGCTNNANGGGTFVPGTAAGVYAATPFTPSFVSALNANAQMARPVSAKVTCSYLGAPNNASGRIVIGFIPPGDASLTWSAAGAPAAALSISTLLSRYTVADIPAAKLYGEARYIPIDPIARSYQVTGDPAVGFRSPASSNIITFGALYAFVDGAPAGQSVEFNVWINWELLPNTNLVSIIQPTCSCSDPLEIAAVSNVLGENPTIPAMQSSDQLLGTAQAAPSGTVTQMVEPARTSDESPSFMDSFFRNAGKAIEVGKKAAPYVASLAALL